MCVAAAVQGMCLYGGEDERDKFGCETRESFMEARNGCVIVGVDDSWRTELWECAEGAFRKVCG